jgi:hypothetical protein
MANYCRAVTKTFRGTTVCIDIMKVCFLTADAGHCGQSVTNRPGFDAYQPIREHFRLSVHPALPDNNQRTSLLAFPP